MKQKYSFSDPKEKTTWKREYLALVQEFRVDEMEVSAEFFHHLYASTAYLFAAIDFLPHMIRRRMKRSKGSPFIKEFIYKFFKIWFIWACLFALLIFLAWMDSDVFWNVRYTFYFSVIFLFVLYPSVYFLLMRTAQAEMKDRREGYKVISAPLGVGCIESFLTGRGAIMHFDPAAHYNMLSNDYDRADPIVMNCCSLSGHHIPKTSLKQKPLLTEMRGTSEKNIFNWWSNRMDLTRTQKKRYNCEIKFIMTESIRFLLNDLIAAEPVMEYRFTYLRHSKLLVRIDPIEGYDYAEEVPALLEKLNATIHPWLKDKVKLN